MPNETKLSNKRNKKVSELLDETKPKYTPKMQKLQDIIQLRKEQGLPLGRPKRPKTFAKTLEIYVKQYLNTDESVRHFKKWADQKPGEALPWAWKVVYGDGNGTLGPQKGQVNVLIQILTGRNIPSQPCQGNEQPQAIESQSSDTQSVVVTVPVPENPENR